MLLLFSVTGNPTQDLMLARHTQHPHPNEEFFLTSFLVYFVLFVSFFLLMVHIFMSLGTQTEFTKSFIKHVHLFFIEWNLHITPQHNIVERNCFLGGRRSRPGNGSVV